MVTSNPHTPEADIRAALENLSCLSSVKRDLRLAKQVTKAGSKAGRSYCTSSPWPRLHSSLHSVSCSYVGARHRRQFHSSMVTFLRLAALSPCMLLLLHLTLAHSIFSLHKHRETWHRHSLSRCGQFARQLHTCHHNHDGSYLQTLLRDPGGLCRDWRPDNQS